MNFRYTGLAALFLVAMIPFSGCSKQSETTSQPVAQTESEPAAQDPHDIPMTDAEVQAVQQSLTSYEVAVAKIKTYQDTIRTAIADGTPTHAHRALDELDVVLEHLPTVARDTDVPKSQWATVNTSAQAIRESFNKVHAQIDGGEKPDYQAVAADIDAAVSRLEAVQVATRTSANQERDF